MNADGKTVGDPGHHCGQFAQRAVLSARVKCVKHRASAAFRFSHCFEKGNRSLTVAARFQPSAYTAKGRCDGKYLIVGKQVPWATKTPLLAYWP